ncbi:MAG: NADH-quinone oxidoreductase subunit C [Firmicutes bacterium]|nr:NADH-quinone oxidoreductase subunit C [Bacillota bacterium]
MSEKKFMIQNFEQVEASNLLPRVREMFEGGYRLGQACATKQVDGNIFVLYSFDKDHVLYNLKVNVPANMELQSITDDYWPAFIYENEMHDLFGITFKHLALDYQGKFFKVATPTPWNPQN